MSNSHISYQEFERYARELMATSDRLGDGWQLKRVKIRSEPERIFLVKTTYHASTSTETNSTEDTNCAFLELEDNHQVEESADPAVVTIDQLTPSSQTGTVCVEYHIVYSDSYEVPILYFNATKANGCQISLDDIWNMVSKQLTSSNTDRWSLVTQQEHPLLSRPFYHVHPCHTAKVMGKALLATNRVDTRTLSPCSSERDGTNYLVTWLSTFGPLVGLRVPLRYTSCTAEE